LRETPNLAGAVMRDMLGQWLDREAVPVAEARARPALVQRDVRERERVPAKADSAPRASKRKREEPAERRVRQRTDIGATAAPRAGNPVSNASFAPPGRHKQ
jgi:hypothetical protein